ncbi:alpha-catulin-like [Mizuhopecten yessoensis]|uniref:Alpha-catulin n=1 Tax=Mizuhopecten yessoensis TaxID=6573 RepID=A0A210R5Z0_MIZYE|nr:alpha-catulin-like [Mizuhopecten yessoensis]OWF56469.1 Alpha-catulin [Mizuhopecten yessoensis]
MAQSKNDARLSLEIRTKSVEQTLIPLVTQITTLVNHKDRPKVTDKTARALIRVGQAVSAAVDRFVIVGQSIADDNDDIRQDMCEACEEARSAGVSIQKLTSVDRTSNYSTPKTFTEKTAMVRAARQLLSAVTRVLLLADKVIVKQLLLSKDKVLSSLNELDTVTTFTDFVNCFSRFGNEMVELAHLTGDRQNDLKGEKQRAQMGAARAILEKSTMMLLPSCKTCLRHPDCDTARLNREGVFVQMRRALEMIHYIVTEGGTGQVNGHSCSLNNGDSGICLDNAHHSTSRAVREFEDLVEMTRVTGLTSSSSPDKLTSALDVVVETAQDFTDSAYTPHENRERIIDTLNCMRAELQLLINAGLNQRDLNVSLDMETAILKTVSVSKCLKKLLQDTAMEQASELFKTNEDHDLLKCLKGAGIAGEAERVEELTVKFEEHMEQLEEVCKLFRHIATTEPLVIAADHNDSIIKNIGPLTMMAAKTLSQYPNSKIARENLDTFSDAWESQINDLSVLVKEVNDVCQGRMDKPVYLSLPRPGKHGTTSRGLRPVKLDAEEQAKIAKLGLEMKLITSEMDAETDKWEEPDNDIVKRAKNMSSMAFSMYLFTRGEGPLKTTHDLFVQAEYFAEEGNKLYKTVREFADRVPICVHREELLSHLDRIPSYCQQLQATLKSSTYGKSATFNKVDSAIQETKNLMNAIAKVVTTSFICATKYNIDYRRSPGGSRRWRSQSSADARSNSSDNESVYSSSADGMQRSSSSSRQFSSNNSLDRA